MADNGRYLIGDSLRDKLKSTISKVDSLAPGGPVSRIPTIIEGDGQSFNPKVFRIATFTGAWPINSSKTVTLKYQTATPNTVSVSNLFFPVASTATATQDCAIAKDGTAWFLINVPFSTATAVFAGATATAISVSGTATGTLISTMASASRVTDISLSATLNSADCTITIGKTLTTASSLFVTGTQTGIIVRATATSTFISTTFTATFIRIGV